MPNLIAVVVATIAAFAIGALWYGPLFGKPWREMMGVGATMGNAKLSFAQAMGGGFIATLVMVFILAHLLLANSITSIGVGLTFAFLIWLGFIATVMSNMIWYESRPAKLYFINATHYLVALLVAAFILTWWPW